MPSWPPFQITFVEGGWTLWGSIHPPLLIPFRSSIQVPPPPHRSPSVSISPVRVRVFLFLCQRLPGVIIPFQLLLKDPLGLSIQWGYPRKSLSIFERSLLDESKGKIESSGTSFKRCIFLVYNKKRGNHCFSAESFHLL